MRVEQRSDEELARLCKRNAVENWLHESGCLAAALVGLAMASLVIGLRLTGLLDWSWLLVAYLAFVSFVIVASQIYHLSRILARWRCRQGLRELERRYGCRPFNEYVRAERKAARAGDIVLLLRGCSLPLGHNWWIRIRLSDHGRAGTLETRFGPVGNLDRAIDFGTGQNPKDSFIVVQRVLSPEAAAKFAEAASAVIVKNVRVRPTVRDGFLAWCAIIRGDVPRVTTIFCNLAGIPEAHRDQPHVRLVQRVFAAGRALTGRPDTYSSTRFSAGNDEWES